MKDLGIQYAKKGLRAAATGVKHFIPALWKYAGGLGAANTLVGSKEGYAHKVLVDAPSAAVDLVNYGPGLVENAQRVEKAAQGLETILEAQPHVQELRKGVTEVSGYVNKAIEEKDRAIQEAKEAAGDIYGAAKEVKIDEMSDAVLNKDWGGVLDAVKDSASGVLGKVGDAVGNGINVADAIRQGLRNVYTAVSKVDTYKPTFNAAREKLEKGGTELYRVVNDIWTSGLAEKVGNGQFNFQPENIGVTLASFATVAIATGLGYLGMKRGKGNFLSERARKKGREKYNADFEARNERRRAEATTPEELELVKLELDDIVGLNRHAAANVARAASYSVVRAGIWGTAAVAGASAALGSTPWEVYENREAIEKNIELMKDVAESAKTLQENYGTISTQWDQASNVDQYLQVLESAKEGAKNLEGLLEQLVLIDAAPIVEIAQRMSHTVLHNKLEALAIGTGLILSAAYASYKANGVLTRGQGTLGQQFVRNQFKRLFKGHWKGLLSQYHTDDAAPTLEERTETMVPENAEPTDPIQLMEDTERYEEWKEKFPGLSAATPRELHSLTPEEEAEGVVLLTKRKTPKV